MKLWDGRKKKPEEVFHDTLREIDSFSEYAKQQVCPNCHKEKGFKVGKFERGKQGWELTVTCKCGLHGVLNTTGFSFVKSEVAKRR